MTSLIVPIALILLLLSGCEAQTSPTPQALPATPPSGHSQNIAPDAIPPLVERCARCHGRNGNLGRAGAPYIGGQQQDYLAFAIRAYINGLRHRPHEAAAAPRLNHAQIDALARHYARQKRHWSGLAPTPPARPDPQGQRLSRSCAACHGEQGISQRPGIPTLAGLERSYFIRAVSAYIHGDRQNELMQVYKGALTEADIDALARYYATLKRSSGATPAAAAATTAITATARRCNACHGQDGSGGISDIPHLAGQERGYLVNAIQAYRDSRRQAAMMNRAAAGLSNAQIEALADHFSRQRHQPLPFGQLQFGPDHNPLADGAAIAASCNGCHQNPRGETPNLTSLAPAYLQAALESYRQGERPHPLMERLTRHLNELDIEKVALYYASQPAPRGASPAPEPSQEIAPLSRSCNGCHGERGNSNSPTTPTLAGQSTPYLRRAIQAYAAGDRPHQQMREAVAKLTPAQSDALARYYSQQQREPVEVRPPAPAQRIAAKCDHCHGPDGRSERPDKPVLAGQSERYLISALKDYQSEQRENSTMHAMTELLSNLEIHTIARHYAQQAAQQKY